jgi:ketosteroid isomerase-like protein
VAERAGLEVMDDQRRPAAADHVCGAFGRVVFGAHPTQARERFRTSGRGPDGVSVASRSMDAHCPEDLPLVFQHYFNAGDVLGLMRHYYAPDATYAPVPGVLVHGAEVERAIGALVELGHPIDVRVRHVLSAGDTALLVIDHEIPGLRMSGTATDVVRRQEDGTWRCIIDNPHGGARTVELPEDTLHALSGNPQRRV